MLSYGCPDFILRWEEISWLHKHESCQSFTNLINSYSKIHKKM